MKKKKTEINQYAKRKKKKKKRILSKPEFPDCFFFLATGCCKICNLKIAQEYRAFHLSKLHDISSKEEGEKYSSPEKIKELKAKCHVEIKRPKQKHHYPARIPVGTVINGHPDAKIIYNPVCTKR